MKQVIVTLAEAQTRWHETLQLHTLHTDSTPYTEALGSITAAPITAATPYPPYHKSPFDGYALGRGSTGQTFRVIATIGAGEIYDSPVAPDEAVRLMTGCAVPDYCDTVIMQEQVERHGETMTVTVPITHGANIVPVGEECPAGQEIAPAGSVLTSGLLAVAVGLGTSTFTVYPKVRVLLLTSGHEVIAPGEDLTKGKIYNSNGIFLQSLLTKEGTATVTHYHVSDEASKLAAEIQTVKALAATADMIISTGGVSVGLFDTMPVIYEALGATMLYNRISMRPGSASYGGYVQRAGGQIVPILGLSGNPSAAFNAYHLLAVPVLHRLSGRKDTAYPVVNCRMIGGVHKENPVDRFIQGRLIYDHGEATFTPNQVITSSALLGLAQTNGLAMIPKGAQPCLAGDTVQVLALP